MGNANSTAPPPKVALDIDGIARYLPDPAVVCERAGSAKQLFQLLFTRLRIARERLESVWPKCDADNRTQFMELLFKVNELALAYCHYTFGLRVAQHKITYDQVCGLREGFDALFVALGVQDETQDWDQDVDKAYAELVATLQAKVDDDEYLRAMYTCDEALREHDLNVLDQAQDSTDGKQSSDIARALQSKLFHWSKDTSAKNAVKNVAKATTADKKTNESSLLVQRCQICVLGSTGAGKSSLLNSIVAAEPRLATRTDPADIVKQSSLTFQSAKQSTQRYEVSCWDLGVDTPHGLYFTPKTLFLVCVDLQAYAAQLQRGDERFALDNVFTWLETICTSQSNAEIAVVGTKSDLLDADHMKEVQDDFKRRVQLWAQSFIELVHVSVRWPIKTSLDQLIDRGLVVAGIKDAESSKKTRLAIQEMIDSGKDLSQPMSIRDLRVLDVVQRRRAEAARFSGKARLDRLIVPVSLIKALSRQVEDLAIENCEISLLALRDVREILWFNGPSDPVDQLIALDPSIVQPHVLQEVLFPDNEDDVMDDDTLSTVIQLLCSHGAKWDKTCEGRWTELREEAEDDLMIASDDTLIQAGLATCAQLWLGARQTSPLKPLINVPFGVIKEGEASVKTYFKEVMNARVEELVFRCKVCVVGTGFGGKTSLIKSASRLKPQLQEKLDRTIGIDLFPIQFAHTEEAAQGVTQTKNYEVTCWDFAGQDVYQVAHTLFFSKETLYLLCLDLDDYSKKLDDNSGGDWMKDERLQRHLQDHVFRWTRLIFARQPDAEIVVIGTKADMVPSQEQIKRIFTDFDQRINTWVDNYIMELEVERRADVEENLLFLRLGKRYAVSVKTQEEVEEAFQTIKALILSKPSLSIAMPPLYNEVLKAVHTARREAAAAADQRALVEKVVVRDRILIPKLQAKIDGLDGDVCRRILATFHNLGDILWYQQVGSGQLKEIIILQPTLALNIVREVIDHNHANSKEARFKRLKEDGEMAHDLLMTFGLWKALSDVRKDLVLFFKNLLWLFHLAYPVGTNEMMVTSDLIVPTYWQSKRLDAKQASEQKPLQRQQTVLQSRDVSNASAATWQYEVPMEIARTIFDQFIVASHSKLFKRVVTVQSVQASMPGNFEARIIHQAGTGSTSVDYIKIEVVGATDDACWERMRFFVMAMERVLDGYPGLTFHRELVRQDNSKEKTEPVDKALRELAEAQESGLSVASVRRRMPWLPPSLRWFTEKAWRTPGVLEKIDAEKSIKRIEHMTGTLRTMMETADTKDHFPAVWTIEYEEDASSLWLRLFSEVSGICYHPPIRIPLPPKILSDYGGLILAGVSLFSLIPLPGAGLVKDIVDKAVEITMCGMIDALDDAVESAKVHEFVDLTNGGSSNGAYSREQGTLLLRALLTAKDSSFSMLKVPQLTGLVCAAQPDGRFVWASESEFDAMKLKFPDLILRGAGHPRVESIVDLSISIKSVVGLAKEDWKRVRCAWELVSTRGTGRMDGNTDVHQDKTKIPEWRDSRSAKHRMPSLTALRDYELTIKVQQRASPLMRLLGDEFSTLLCGTVRLNDIIPEQQRDKTFRFEGEVPMERDSSTKVECVVELFTELRLDDAEQSVTDTASHDPSVLLSSACWLYEVSSAVAECVMRAFSERARTWHCYRSHDASSITLARQGVFKASVWTQNAVEDQRKLLVIINVKAVSVRTCWKAMRSLVAVMERVVVDHVEDAEDVHRSIIRSVPTQATNEGSPSRVEEMDRVDGGRATTAIIDALAAQAPHLLHDVDRDIGALKILTESAVDSEEEQTVPDIIDPAIVVPVSLRSIVLPSDRDLHLDRASQVSVAKALCATWDREALDHKPAEDTSLLSAYELEQLQWRGGLATCVHRWIDDTVERREMVEIPNEVIRQGQSSVETFLKLVEQSTHVLLRRKICIVGASSSGKTSLIKSLVANKPVLEDADTRTIGIDVFPWSFTESIVHTDAMETRRYEVVCWDFAGQDIYHVAHSLFFSKRTLYLVCVDVHKYAQLLARCGDSLSRGHDLPVARFVYRNMFRWLRLILARQTDAELQIVGTKDNLVGDSKAQDVLDDLVRRLQLWTREIVSEYDGARRLQVERSITELHLRGILLTSCATVASVTQARQSIENLIKSNRQRAFPMPTVYSRVLESVRRRRQVGSKYQDDALRVSAVVVPAEELVGSLRGENSGLSATDCRNILQTLHDLGDLLWYDARVASSAREWIILDPTLLLDLVREVVDHNHEDRVGEDFDVLRRDGWLRHSLLETFRLWGSLSRQSPEHVLFFKHLLQHFKLVYPRGSNELTWQSDLIVPSFWQLKNQQPEDIVSKTMLALRRGSVPYRARWRYSLRVEVAETVFNQFVVKSYSDQFERSVTAAGLRAFTPFQFEAYVRFESESDQTKLSKDRIVIDVVATTESIAWRTIRFFVVAMEQVLDTFPGLPVDRHVLVEAASGKEKAYSVGPLVDQLAKRSANPGRPVPRGLPPQLNWFRDHVWQDAAMVAKLNEEELEKEAVQRRQIAACLIETTVRVSRFPVLWKIVVNRDAHTVELQILSDLSGECCHDPFVIEVPTSFLNKHKQWLQDGASVFSFLPDEATTKMVDCMGSGVTSPLRDVTMVQPLGIDAALTLFRLDIQVKGPLAMLRDVLERLGLASTGTLDNDLLNLTKTRIGDGREVWAHPSEVLMSPVSPHDTARAF